MEFQSHGERPLQAQTESKPKQGTICGKLTTEHVAKLSMVVIARPQDLRSMTLLSPMAQIR